MPFLWAGGWVWDFVFNFVNSVPLVILVDATAWDGICTFNLRPLTLSAVARRSSTYIYIYI